MAVVKRDRFWGQGDNVLPDLPPADSAAAGGEAAASVMPLGQTLELLLDPGAFDVKDRSKKSS